MRIVLKIFENQRGRIILFSKDAPPSPCPHLRRRCPAQVAVLHAIGVGSRPYGSCCYLRAAPRGLAVSPRVGAAPAGAALAVGLPFPALQRAAVTCGLAARAAAPCGCAAGNRPLRPGRSRSCLRGCCHCGWPLSVAPLQVAGRPCKGAGRGHARLPLVRASFTAKMQQERVERFYAIQSHHTQFKTNLSHEILGSDTTVGKHQRGYHYHMALLDRVHDAGLGDHHGELGVPSRGED
ncbi:hypothetical protein GW17_00057398 [Ensete ventricosum]|nr:hypothetical protein GW17_00057398 [Ensete ventricosum]